MMEKVREELIMTMHKLDRLLKDVDLFDAEYKYISERFPDVEMFFKTL